MEYKYFELDKSVDEMMESLKCYVSMLPHAFQDEDMPNDIRLAAVQLLFEVQSEISTMEYKIRELLSSWNGY